MRKRYLVWIVLAFLLGILHAEQNGAIFIIVLFLLGGIISISFYRANYKKQAVLLCLAFGISFMVGEWRWNQQQQKKETYAAVIVDGAAVQLQGTLYKKEEKQNTNLLYLKNCWLKAGTQIYQTQDFIVYHEKISYSLGNTLCVNGTIKALQEPLNEGTFDEKTYYESQMIIGKIFANNIRVVDGKINLVQNTMYLLKQRMKRVFEECMSKTNAGTMSAIALGEKNEMDSEVKQLYQNSGIAHILCISGLHISIVGMGLFRVLRGRGISYGISGAVSFLAVYAFGTLSGLGLSTKRAAIMFTIYLMAQITGRAYDSLTALSVAAIILLMQNPFLLKNIAFQLSFLAVFATGEIYPILNNKKKWCQSFVLCFSVQVITIPITIWNFYEIPTYVIGLNLCVLPFVGILLGCGLISSVVGCVWLKGAAILLQVSEWILNGYSLLLKQAQKFPCAVWITGKPPMWTIMIYYIVVALVILYLKRKKEQLHCELIQVTYTPQIQSKEKQIGYLKKKHIKRQCFGMGILFCTIVMSCVFPKTKELEVDMLDVGQGDGIYLSNSVGTSIFIDGGSSSVKQVGKYRILPFLKSKGIRKISYWFVSHTDEDHISGIVDVLQSGYQVEYLILAKYRGKGENEDSLVKAAKKANCKIAIMDAGQSLKTGEMEIKCLFPDKNFSNEDLNGRSMVLEIREGGFSGIFTGDIPKESEAYLLQQNIIQPVLLYKVAHHGSKGSNSEAFIQALNPKISVASAGKKNRYGHPATEVVKRIEESGSLFFSTLNTGQIRISCAKTGFIMEKYGKMLERQVIPVID